MSFSASEFFFFRVLIFLIKYSLYSFLFLNSLDCLSRFSHSLLTFFESYFEFSISWYPATLSLVSGGLPFSFCGTVLLCFSWCLMRCSSACTFEIANTFFFNLATPALSCSTWGLWCSLQYVRALVAACQLFTVACKLSLACGIFPDQGWNLGPLHWE